MRNPITTCLLAAALGIAGAGGALGQGDGDRQAMCSDALAEQIGVDASAIEAAPAEEIAGAMVVTLVLEGATWVCTFDDAGEIAALEPSGE
jgi:hypothetical protein